MAATAFTATMRAAWWRTLTPATPLPRSIGAEVGARTAVVPGLQSSVSLWLLDLNSELVWDGDVGGE